MLEWSVKLVAFGQPIATIPFGLDSLDGSIVGMDVLDTDCAQMVGDGMARVSVSASQTMGLPNYGSAKLSVTVTLTCDQSDDSVRLVQEKALYLCGEFLNEHFPACYEAAHNAQAEMRKGEGE